MDQIDHSDIAGSQNINLKSTMSSSTLSPNSSDLNIDKLSPSATLESDEATTQPQTPSFELSSMPLISTFESMEDFIDAFTKHATTPLIQNAESNSDDSDGVGANNDTTQVDYSDNDSSQSDGSDSASTQDADSENDYTQDDGSVHDSAQDDSSDNDSTQDGGSHNDDLEHADAVNDESTNDSADNEVDSDGSVSPVGSPAISHCSTATSTWTYSQEPFDTYCDKVNRLCIDIGLGEPSTIEHMYGGSYNRVVGLTYRSDSETRRHILRIPRSWNEDKRDKQSDIQSQAETTMWLQKFDFLCVPKVLAIDTTTDNALQSPYVLQERLQGISVEDLFFDNPAQLPLSERLEVAKSIAKFMIKLETITLDKPGRLVGTLDVPWTSTDLGSCIPLVEIDGFRLNPVQSASPLEKQNLPSLLSKMICAHMKVKLKGSIVDEMWQKLLSILEQMENLNLFKPSDCNNVLWHWDLEARHIFVNKSESGKWAISGTLDWDDVLSVPRILTRAPKSWLWYNEDRYYMHTDLGTCSWDGEYDIPLAEPLNEEVAAIKDCFDRVRQEADPEYMDDTYGRGFWIRRLARFAREGFCSSCDFRRHRKFVEDWEHYLACGSSIYSA